MMVHRPMEKKIVEGSFVQDCLCGWRCVLWSTSQGASRAFLQHLVDEWREVVGLPDAVVVMFVALTDLGNALEEACTVLQTVTVDAKLEALEQVRATLEQQFDSWELDDINKPEVLAVIADIRRQLDR